MDDNDLFEDEECLQCDDCGTYYPKTALRRCRICGKVVCRNCREDHEKKHNHLKRNQRKEVNCEVLFKAADYFIYTSTIKLRNLFSRRTPGIRTLTNVLIISLVFLGFMWFGGYLSYNDVETPDNTLPPNILEGGVVEKYANPHIVMDDSYVGTSVRTMYFNWRGIEYPVTAEVEASLYRGAKSDESDIYSGDLEEYYVRKTTDVLQEGFYEDVLTDLREIKVSQNLDSDEYAELIASFVQGIPYDDYASNNVRYPVVVFFDGKGDCDEKSMFLCGLLAKEGYDVALLDLPEINHMSVGIKSSNFADGYVDGYLFLESTGPSLVGEVPFDDADKNPEYFRIGDGVRQYMSYSDVKEIFAYRERLYVFLNGWVIPMGDIGAQATYTHFEKIYYYLYEDLNAGDREYAYSLVRNNPLVRMM